MICGSTNIEICIPLDSIKGGWRERSLEFWHSMGFKPEGNGPYAIAFTSGSLLKNLYTFKQQSIKRKVHVFIEDDCLIAQLIPDMTFRAFFTDDDPGMPYMHWEMDEFEKYLKLSPADAQNYHPEFLASGKIDRRSMLKLIALAALAGTAAASPFAAALLMATVKRKVSVYLIPYNGFDPYLADVMARWLSYDLRIRIATASPQLMPNGSLNSARMQYAAEEVLKHVDKVSADFPDKATDAIYIGLVNGSLYSEISPRLRYVFSMNTIFGCNVVGNFEMLGPEEIYQWRLYKIIKRAIGKTYFKYPESKDLKSVMRPFLKGVQDLDEMGVTYDNGI